MKTIWETDFMKGKQKRRKVHVIDGEPVHDIDANRLRDAGDIVLH